MSSPLISAMGSYPCPLNKWPFNIMVYNTIYHRLMDDEAAKELRGWGGCRSLGDAEGLLLY